MSNKDLVAKVGGYIKDGQQKSRYMKIGVLVTKDDGAFALIDPTVNFAGILLRQNMMQETDRDSVMISIFDQERPANSTPNPTGKPSLDFDDDIGF
tara:strand:+ start:439 stop:726 length:288 start_codon:yes stop_codon:yes gene_type:complete